MPRTRNVGLFVNNTNHFGRGILAGITAFCQSHSGWKAHFPVGRHDDASRKVKDEFDGIIADVRSQALADALESWGKPVVDVYNRVPECRLPRVCADSQASGRAGAEHLLDLGYPHIAFCAYATLPFSRGREAAFCQTIRQIRGDSFPIYQIAVDSYDQATLASALGAWITALPKPVAVMAVVDAIALELLDACRDRDIRVPDQVAVVGAGNDVQVCQRARPMLSSVDVGKAQIGYQAASLLDAMMSGKPRPTQTILMPSLGVIARESTDAPLRENPKVGEALRYIREHACDPIQVGDVLARVKMSRRTFERQFMQVRGRSPHAEIRRVQMQRAMRLLAQTQIPLNLNEVASASGFGSAEWMNHVFRRTVGMTPGEHRRRFAPVNAPLRA